MLCDNQWFSLSKNEVCLQELTGELRKLELRETDLKLTSEPPLLLDTENNEMHKVLDVETFTNRLNFSRAETFTHRLNFPPGDIQVSADWILPHAL